jgi:hypothetical protein
MYFSIIKSHPSWNSTVLSQTAQIDNVIRIDFTPSKLINVCLKKAISIKELFLYVLQVSLQDSWDQEGI